VAEILNNLKYKLLNCLTFDAFWMLTGRELQTEAPEHVHEVRNISCRGLGVYKLHVETDRSSRVWISDVKVKDVIRSSGASQCIVLYICRAF